MRTRRTFSRAFKREAASMVLDQGFKVADVCHQLEVGETALRRWVDQVKFERTGGVPKAEALTDEQRKIQKLEAANLVKSKKEGRTRICEMAPDAFTPARDWLMEQSAIWEGRLDRFDDHIKNLMQERNK
ncbi:MAG: transposase [Litorivicinus sp.]